MPGCEVYRTVYIHCVANMHHVRLQLHQGGNNSRYVVRLLRCPIVECTGRHSVYPSISL